MKKTHRWLIAAATVVATLGVGAIASTAHAAETAERPLPPTVVVQAVEPRANVAPMSVAATSPSSLSYRCYPANTFLSGGEAASWLGASVAGDSSWPLSPEPPSRVRAANGGWVGAPGSWAMVSPGADHMTRIWVHFETRC